MNAIIDAVKATLAPAPAVKAKKATKKITGAITADTTKTFGQVAETMRAFIAQNNKSELTNLNSESDYDKMVRGGVICVKSVDVMMQAIKHAIDASGGVVKRDFSDAGAVVKFYYAHQQKAVRCMFEVCNFQCGVKLTNFWATKLKGNKKAIDTLLSNDSFSACNLHDAIYTGKPQLGKFAGYSQLQQNVKALMFLDVFRFNNDLDYSSQIHWTVGGANSMLKKGENFAMFETMLEMANA